MPLCTCLALFFSLALALTAAAAPIAVKELEFLVRQGIPEEEIVIEVTQRRLAAPLDDASVATLTSRGASASLVARLKASAMLLSPEESLSQLQRLLAEEARAKKAAGEGARAKAELAQRHAPLLAATTAGSSSATRQMLEGKLVRLDGSQLKPYDAKDLAKVRIFAFYYSAGWCGPCRTFTPQLVEAYHRLKAKHPEFEVVFVSSDRDEFNMGEYMRSHQMPWPAVRFGAKDGPIKQFAARGIPWLVAVSDAGVPLTKNGVDKQYMSPPEVLNGIEYLLGKVAVR